MNSYDEWLPHHEIQGEPGEPNRRAKAPRKVCMRWLLDTEVGFALVFCEFFIFLCVVGTYEVMHLCTYSCLYILMFVHTNADIYETYICILSAVQRMDE